jgi:signal transduction histidine kinase
VRLALFRVFQQSLGNVLRHSGATEVQVRFSFDVEEARLEIWDNGQGFEVPSNWIELVRQGHYGLAGSAERVHSLGGRFEVQSRPGESTLVRAVIPWKEFMD